MLMTFLSPENLWDIKEKKEIIHGKEYCETTDSYYIGVIPKCSDPVQQAALICSYMSHKRNVLCVLIDGVDESRLYDVICVNNNERHLDLASVEECLAVVDNISAVMIKKVTPFVNVTSFHEVLRYYLPMLLHMFEHDDIEFVNDINWELMEKQWTEMEKTNTLTADNYRLIKKAIKG